MFYQKSTRFYDALYHHKNYAREVLTLKYMFARYGTRPYHTLLDVATGTGKHLALFAQDYAVEGLDLEPQMIEIARARLGPAVPLHLADMTTFDLGKTFDIVTCLFSAIAYLTTVDALAQAIANMARHTAAGGLVVIEPWLSAEAYGAQTIHNNAIDLPDISVRRMIYSSREGDISVMEWHHLVGIPDKGISYFVETHRLRMFSDSEYRAAFTAAGLRVAWDEEGLTGRGLYVGVR
jgi:SAM-dependent methyltransferase